VIVKPGAKLAAIRGDGCYIPPGGIWWIPGRGIAFKNVYCIRFLDKMLDI
jgi:hypothetical protein